MKNLLSTHIIYRTLELIKYSALKGAPISICNLCVTTPLLKGALTATAVCNCSAFKGAPSSKSNVQVLCFQRGSQQLFKASPNSNCNV